MNLNEKIEATGTRVANKTYEYLFPFLKTYKYNLQDKLMKLEWLAMGIGDFYFDEDLQSRLFVLVNVQDGEEFQKFIEWFRDNKYHVADYPFDDIHFKESDLHMIVVDFADENTFNAFINSKFSQMYKGQNINKFIRRIIPKLPKGGGAIKAIHNPVYQVITRSEEYKKIFIEKIAEEYGTILTVKELAERELDLPLDKSEEIFNYD